MIRLKQDREPFTIELLPGISVTVKPLTTRDKAVCEAAARHRLDNLAESYDLCEESGLADSALDLDDPAIRAGLFQDFYIKDIAVRHITGWEGVVCGDSDDPAPLTPENIRTLMDDLVISEIFFNRVMRYHRELADSKKGSGAAPNGISPAAAVPDIAPDVLPTGSLAHAEGSA